jgi:aminopeptidase N
MILLPGLALLQLLAASPTRAPLADDSLMAPGVSRALALKRVSQISDVRYALHLDVTRRDTALGKVVVRFTRRLPGDVILDWRGLALGQVNVNETAGASVVSNGAHIRVPASLLRNGENSVELEFRSRIAPAGASIIRFHDETDGNDYLYTLLVPSDANALFPCFDQPDLKARTTFSLDVPARWTALANGITEHIDSSGNARTFSFRETEPLSTYLLAFAAGPWTKFVGGPRSTTLYVRASRAREVEVDSLQNQVGSALTSLEKYFGVSYPFQQFQYLLAPAFPFGGMEHPGAVFFNEESFIYREPPTLNQRLGRRATIYHEVAHQWFGDLVTMRWFDDLWLKEGFATYMAAKMQAIEGLPNPWMSFYLRNKPAAYDVDVTAGTTPVWQELTNLDQAKSNYGAIVYNKAPGVLKQLNYLVGDSAFRAGVHDFLVTHRYGNATWRDLLASIATPARRPLTTWGTQYILRPGIPVIEQHLDIADGRIRKLTLVQHPAQALSGKGNWPIKLELLLQNAGAAAQRIPVEITAESTVVRSVVGQGAPDFVYANAEDNAYALVLIDDRSSAWLLSHIGSVSDPFLRAMLWGSLWDLVREARLPPRQFVEAAVAAIPFEKDEQIAAGLVGRLARATSVYLSDAQRPTIQPAVEALLLAGASDSSKAYGTRKNLLDTYIDIATTPSALVRLDAWLDSNSTAGIPLRQPTRWSIITTLVARDAKGSGERLIAEAKRDTSTGGQRRVFVAKAARPTVETKRSYFDRYVRDSTLNEEWVTSSLRAFNDPDQRQLTIPFLVPALDTLPWIQRNRRIFFLGSWLSAFIGGQRDQSALDLIDRFLHDHGTLPIDLRRKILQSRDELERTVKIRSAYAIP